MKPFRVLSVVVISFLFFCHAKAQAPADPSSIIGKVVCGYQGWFTATGDGSPINRWTHWSITTAPQPGVAPNPNPNLTFDIYPDVSIYYPTSLFQTNFANLGDGKKSKLFSSYKQDVTDKHFELLQTHGIDGVAFQRFIYEVLIDPAFKANRDTIAVHVKKSAEKYSRLFYIAYDLSGLGVVPAADDQVRFDSVKGDWKNNVIAKLNITSSPMYAKQGGKPVVQIWGIGYNHVIGTAAQQFDLINWFKTQGCYVIIGVPADWRKGGAAGAGAAKAGWVNTYLAANMVSPWSVGGYNNQASTDAFKTTYITPDLTYCNTNSMAYQPVIFPGFSWYNWNSGTKNQIPRNKGEFLWRQATNLSDAGITTAEIAMLDEFDEGTAILPMADGFSMIPTDQYFVTGSADGTYLSSDFYLRLATKVSKVIKQEEAKTTNVAIPYSIGPLYFRTSNETDFDPTPTWTNTTDAISNVKKYGTTFGTPTCGTINENPHLGQYAIKVMGRDNSATASFAYFKVFDVNIPVVSTTELSFWSYPLNPLGTYISVDLTMTDGTTLRDAGAIDQNGISMHPATGRGTVNSWTRSICNIGTWLNGKTIDKITIGYDHALQTGDFSGYIDDIQINDQSYIILPVKLNSFSAAAVKGDVLIQWQTSEESDLKKYEIERGLDGLSFNTIKEQLPIGGKGIKDYSATDRDVNLMDNATKQFYYRLKIINTDGGFAYSNIQKVNFGNSGNIKINVFPNPLTDKVEVSINAPKEGYVETSISDGLGKILISKKSKVQKGLSSISIKEVKNLPRGIYFLKVKTSDTIQTIKLEK